MNTREARRQFNHDKAWAEKAIIKDGRLGPLVVVHGEGTIAPLAMTQFGSRETAWQIARLVATAQAAHAVVMIAESWTMPPGEAQGLVAAGLTPTQSGRRIECVSVAMMYRDDADECHSLLSIRPIERRASGKISGLGPEWSIPDGDDDAEAGGSFAAVLPDHRPNDGERAFAQALLDRLGIVNAGLRQ